MALINCPECGKEISDQAVACPNCGLPIKPTKNREPKSSGIPADKRAPLVIILIISALLFVRAYFVFTIDVNDYTEPENPMDQYVEDAGLSEYVSEAEEYINGDDEDDSMKDVNTLMKAPYILFILVFVALLVEVLALHRYDSKILNIVHIIYLIIVWIDDFFSMDVIMDSNFAEDKKHGLGMLCLMVLVVSFVLCLVFIKYNQKVLDDKTPQVVA